MDQPSGRAHQPGILGDRTHQVHLHLERGVNLALRERGLDRAGHARIHQRHREAAMHNADRIVVLERRQAFENRLAFFDMHEIEAERLGDRRRGQRSVRDRLQKAEPVIGQDLVGRRDAEGPHHVVHVTLRIG